MNDITEDPKPIFDTLKKILEAKDYSDIVHLINISTLQIDQTGYERYVDGEAYLFTIYIKVPPTYYAKIHNKIHSIEKLIKSTTSEIMKSYQSEYIEHVVIAPQIVTDDRKIYKPITENIDKLLEEIENLKSIMISVATGNDRIQDVDDQYKKLKSKIKRALKNLNVDDPNNFNSLWDFYGKWKQDLPTYHSRRQYVSELYSSCSNQLDELNEESGKIIYKPTGWIKVDRGIDEARNSLEQAENEEQFQAIGLICRETIISLAQAIYDQSSHQSSDGIVPSKTDATRMIEAYLLKNFSGKTNEVLRRFAKSSLDLANQLQHKRTAKFQDAALCIEATASLINLIAIISGRRNP